MKKKTISGQSPTSNPNIAAVQSSPKSPFHLVGLGASAGGLEALERFFTHMAGNSGMAFIVVSHLDPNHRSIMPELIQKFTGMKVFQAEDGMVVRPNEVYVAPANSDLGVLHGTIQLIEPHEPHGFRLPINFCFTSLAADAGDKAICIIFSGMASDGTAGLRTVKGEMGLVMVQEPGSAKYDGMPNSAIKTGLVDYILPPEEMPDQLMQYVARFPNRVLPEKTFVDGKSPDALQKVFILLRSHTGHDFSQYKANTICRRVERRMQISQLDDLPAYTRLLQDSPAEIDRLFKELLIGVTHFFRDPESFERLKTAVSEMVRNKPDNGQIRMWVPGCSTGEEAYSLAIIVRECMDEAKKNLTVQIFATDIDSQSIDKARTGSYSGIDGSVSKERLSRFFVIEDNSFRIRKEIREMLVFAPHSVIKDPPFTRLDLIACRNLLIYFNAELQKKLIPIFHYSLTPNGILFLGPSETINAFVDLFSILDQKWKLYRRRDSLYSAQPLIEFPMSRSTDGSGGARTTRAEVEEVGRRAEKIILRECAPDCVIVTEDGDIAYVHGNAGRYLELAHGEARMNIFEMAREGLQHELHALIRKVITGRKTLTAERVRVRSNGRTYVIDLTVTPIKEPNARPGSLLVVFKEVRPPTKASQTKRPQYEKKSEIVIKELERELKATRTDLRSTIEELEAANEELKSTNEEMQSTNEEMQSSNEELETSKEELQSLNEELVTVNTELQNRNDELSIVNNDMKNLLDSIDVPTIFLDSNLCIKRFTFHATKVMNLISSDVGRPIEHLAARFTYPGLVDDAKEVLRTLAHKDVELQTNDAVWYHMRILPYRTTNDVIDGVVITFSDINTLKTMHEKLISSNRDVEHAREYADNIIDTVKDPLLILDKDLRVVSANRSFHRMFNTTHNRTVGRHIYELDDVKWNISRLKELLEQIIPAQKHLEDYEIEYSPAGAGMSKLLVNARQMLHGEKETDLILLAIQSPRTTN
jgi:two-component system CheB/CheR fusion protein